MGCRTTTTPTSPPTWEAVTLSETHRVAGKRVDDEHLAVLVVGDRETVEPELAKMGLPIVHVDYEGRRLTGG